MNLILKYFVFLIAVIIGINPIIPQAEEYPADSLYTVSMSWVDDQGASTTLAKYSGKPVVLTMAYSHCKSACPITIERLRKIEGELVARNKEVEFVVVSLDPAIDTPEKLLEFKQSHHIDRSNWHLLRGSDGDVRKLAVLIGYSFKRDFESEEIMHSNRILLLEVDGRVLVTLDGLNSDIEPLVKAN